MSRGFSNLLVMDPGLGELAAEVEPGRHRVVTCPADVCWLEGVSLLRPLVDLAGGVEEEVTDDTRTELPRRLDPPVVLGCQRVGQRIRALDPKLASQVTVAAAGEPSKIAVKKVKDDVLHSPPSRCRGSGPLPRRELIEKSEQIRTFLTKSARLSTGVADHTSIPQHLKRVTEGSLIGHVRTDRGIMPVIWRGFRRRSRRCRDAPVLAGAKAGARGCPSASLDTGRISTGWWCTTSRSLTATSGLLLARQASDARGRTMVGGSGHVARLRRCHGKGSLACRTWWPRRGCQGACSRLTRQRCGHGRRRV